MHCALELMGEGDTVSVGLPEELVERAEGEGLRVAESCKIALKRRIDVLKEVDSGGTEHYNPDSYDGNYQGNKDGLTQVVEENDHTSVQAGATGILLYSLYFGEVNTLLTSRFKANIVLYVED